MAVSGWNNRVVAVKDDGFIQLGFVDALKIRSFIFSYLTQLEAIFSALYTKATDSKMIENRMRYLKEKIYYDFLRDVIDALGDYGSFPNIEKFVKNAEGTTNK